MAIAGLVLGIVSLVMALAGIGLWFLPFAGIVMSIVGLVLSCLARKKAKNGITLAGIIIGIISVVLNGVFSIACGICVGVAACVVDSAAEAVVSLFVI